MTSEFYRSSLAEALRRLSPQLCVSNGDGEGKAEIFQNFLLPKPKEFGWQIFYSEFDD